LTVGAPKLPSGSVAAASFTLRSIAFVCAFALVATLPAACGSSASTPLPSPPPGAFRVPTAAGLNYGMPRTRDGKWLGTRWLQGKNWPSARESFIRDLDGIRSNHLGSVLRLFIGLDQLMVWDPEQGFQGFDETALEDLQDAFGIVDSHQMRLIVVLYDQEEQSSAGNFHYEALDGRHPGMRAGYVQATQQFMARFGNTAGVAGWDLFNEAYNSLGTEGGLPRPPAADPVSPNYDDGTVHRWLKDLYGAARRGAPGAWLTVSDTTDLYWKHPPDPARYADVVDFYDIHVYDDHPRYPDWKGSLKKPYIVGEAGASVRGSHFDDQTIDPPVLKYLLDNASQAGVRTVLAQGRALSGGTLTPIGEVVAAYVLRTSAQA
jgi:hypothetical protein